MDLKRILEMAKELETETVELEFDDFTLLLTIEEIEELIAAEEI